MPVNYDFYKNPKLADKDEKTHLHARVVPKGTVSSDDLAEEIHDRSTLSTADITATLVALADITAEKLRDGQRVYIKGIGYLQMTLQCPPVESESEIRAESVRFKSVAFRPDSQLKERLSTTHFVRQADKSHSKNYSTEEIDRLVARHFQQNETLTRNQFEALCGLTYSTAVRHLKRLREEGKIINIASQKHPLYRKGTGFNA